VDSLAFPTDLRVTHIPQWLVVYKHGLVVSKASPERMDWLVSAEDLGLFVVFYQVLARELNKQSK